jgi:hypothetical protein
VPAFARQVLSSFSVALGSTSIRVEHARRSARSAQMIALEPVLSRLCSIVRMYVDDVQRPVTPWQATREVRQNLPVARKWRLG